MEDIETLRSSHGYEDDALVIHADYFLCLTCEYVDRDGQDNTFAARPELTVRFILEEVSATADADESAHHVPIKGAFPAEEIELLN